MRTGKAVATLNKPVQVVQLEVVVELVLGLVTQQHQLVRVLLLHIVHVILLVQTLAGVVALTRESTQRNFLVQATRRRMRPGCARSSQINPTPDCATAAAGLG